jgi:hypothetical protein
MLCLATMPSFMRALRKAADRPIIMPLCMKEQPVIYGKPIQI